MKKYVGLLFCFVALVVLGACERPKAPDFKLNNKLQAPLTVGKTYRFLGTDNALIDTTKSDLDSLFSVDGDGLVKLTKEKKFDFQDLDDAIPIINVDPTKVSTAISDINLSNFSSVSPVGSVDFSSITGFSGDSFKQGQPLPAGATPRPVGISNLNTDYFKSATFKSDGSLDLELINELGFDLSTLTITLKSNGVVVGSANISNFEHGTQRIGKIPINGASTPGGITLSNIGVEIQASWGAQNMKADAKRFIVNKVSANNLVASEVDASVPSQQFNGSGRADVSNNEFSFTKPEHFISLSDFRVSIDIVNNIELGIDELKITFPDIRRKSASGVYDDTLVLDLNDIPSKDLRTGKAAEYSRQLNPTGTNSDNYYRIYGYGNSVRYQIFIKSESTLDDPNSTQIRQIKAGDQLEASIGINNLTVEKAFGEIATQRVLLNDDVNSDKSLDIFNDNEAMIVDLKGLNDISEKISNITFANPVLSSINKSNQDINTTIYAGIAGTSRQGNTVYLTAKPGKGYDVSSPELTTEFKANGRVLNKNQLIKFDAIRAGSIIDSVSFDTATTNIANFFNNLPTSIRFIGFAEINPGGGEATIQRPVFFRPKLRADLPFNFSADNALFSDTVDADLSSLPGPNDDQRLKEATLTVNYTNRLPLSLDLSLRMLDDNGDEVTRYPVNAQKPLRVNPAMVGASGFVEPGSAEKGKLQMSFTKDQLDVLNRTQKMELNIRFDTSNKQKVKFHADDSITLRLKMSVNLISSVN